MKEVNTKSPWVFELGNQEDLNVPVWIIKGFQ